MKRRHAIVGAACVLYLVALGLSWQVGTRNAVEKTHKLIGRSERDFTASICGAVDSVLLHSCAEVINCLQPDLWAADHRRLVRCLDRFQIDEINLVDSNGVIRVSSELPLQGRHIDDNPVGAEFMRLLHGTKTYSQPFRHGLHNQAVYRKYYGKAFDDGSGFVEVGIDFDHIAGSMYTLNRRELRAWLFGRCGYFDLYDKDGDGVCDYDRTNPRDGEIREVSFEGKHVFIRPFSYCGYHYIAVLPAREYFSERNANFVVFSASLAVVFLFLAYFVLYYSKTMEHDREHHRREETVRKRDLAMAKSIQLSVLPTSDHYRKAMFTASFAATTVPAKEVGGDFYDFYFIDSTHIALIVADVSGKGISAAMFMMQAKNKLYNALCSEHELTTAVAAANLQLCENNEAEMFVTVWAGIMDVYSGELEYVNAGHNRPFVRRADGTVEKLMGQGGLILGMFPKAKYKSSHFALKPDDFLFLFSDGVTEAMDRERRPYGEDRLRGVLTDCEPVPESILRRVGDSVSRYADGMEQSDDLTALALVWHGLPASQRRTFAAKEESLAEAMDWLDRVIELSGRMAKSRILNAADEMMTNIVNYSGADEFTMTVENSLRRTRLTFVDRGREYNPLSHVDPDTHAPLESRPVGGLGILMTKRLVDAVHYQREDDVNVLTIVKLDD